MHELSIAESMMSVILENVKNKDFNKIHKVVIVVGKLSGVAADSLKFCFEAIKEATPVHDAELVVEEPPAVAFCAPCDKTLEAGPYDFFCPLCDHVLEIRGGKELYVKEVELE